MEIRKVNIDDYRDFVVDNFTAIELGINPGTYQGFSRIYGPGMVIFLSIEDDESGGYVIFINFDDLTRNENARNLVKQVTSFQV